MGEKETKKNRTFHKIQRTNTKFLLVIIIIVFPYLTSTDNTVFTSHSIPKESKALICFLNKTGTEMKLQSFNLNDILKDFEILRKDVLFFGLFLNNSWMCERQLLTSVQYF